MKKAKIIAVIPAYNAAKTIKKICGKIPKDFVDEIVVVDDGSSDNTLGIVKQLGVKYCSHPSNRGYGASQKTGFKYALELGADIIIMLHADMQHDPKYIKYFLPPIVQNKFDIILGSRIRNSIDAIKKGMPIYKVMFNRFLTLIENVVLNLDLTEYHTGYRAFRRNVLKTLNLNHLSDDFIFDQQILLAAKLHKFRIGEVPTSCIYHKDASSINLLKSIKYGFGVISNLLIYLINRKRFS